MILIKRRRLIVWLVKAYFKKWRKTIALSFILGLAIFFILKYTSTSFVKALPFTTKETVGIVGVYTPDNLPEEIQRKLSRGLTYLDNKGMPQPDVASDWEVKDGGRTYVFHLKKDIKFTDGGKVDSSKIRYNFKDVKEERPDKYTIIYKLKEPYSPFLVTVSRPFFKNDLVGVGAYRLKRLNINGDFVESVDLASIKNDYLILSYQMYPTEKALKTAFALGEITKAINLNDISIKKTTFAKFNNSKIYKSTNYNELITVFFSSRDPILSDKRIRQALLSAVPDSFAQGERSHIPFPPNSWASAQISLINQMDLEQAKSLIDKADSATKGSELSFSIKTLPDYKVVAEQLQKNWKLIGVNTKIETVESLPSSFQIFLGDFKMPKDPDQYTIWHSDQNNNITGYNSMRIDKLLEDGRQIPDINKRQKIYADFTKYLLDDAPAAFLYFPYSYTISR